MTFTSTRSGETRNLAGERLRGWCGPVDVHGRKPRVARWSPTGEQIAFHSNPDGNGDIILVPAEGGKPRNLTSHPATDTFPTFSRDGRWVYFSSTRSGQSRIWKIPVSGGAGGPGLSGPWNDGDRIAGWGVPLLHREHDHEQPRAVVAYSGSRWSAVKITDGVNSTSFDVVNGGIYYLERVAGERDYSTSILRRAKTITVAGNLGNVDFGLACIA